ncbi:MAG: hypothetical protein COZ06_29155 [Armatimonadetes bacterium CG_4_10_14_3_um_filter_66_18]|nr:hypothetical protein [Armatimonadota bacterium]OIP12145.1 MAG: hypothetical protein AUJ96_00895 [Armatimonadetes bacterium CG2_30_66_41]PIU89339.1 MAG: hypothetical protein COS65_28815 [Armatimonadetes bacterium CG06_land_8_20_14_3_00_66_21]PIY39768.1 MAG: hypothetical protein COZ06_29155 [Armatimonadetes bacterium CG_4_10_14_3_um_filter_66_18]PIZ46304.1 MAG: hypothetical protein COY42_10895 [Armatimonadetes bacterium CG_4_10_14_0_8_um_filter_66_14]PJB60466.1 MAG: hypothetical protein CO096
MTSNTSAPALWPTPKELLWQPGGLQIGASPASPHPLARLTGGTDSYAAEALSRRLAVPGSGARADAVPVVLSVDPALDVGSALRIDRRVEADRLTVSREEMQEAKLAELSQFVAEVQPAFMYVHDIDAGTFADSRHAWGVRCAECRRRWPSDEMTSPDGQAGAVAAWFRKLRQRLSAVSVAEGYCPGDDLVCVFTSPVYTHRHEGGQPEVWEQEVAYFRLLSSLVGPLRGGQFGLREQLLHPGGEARIAQLRRALDEVGNGHGLHVFSFGGGDNYQTDDLVNVLGALAHLYRGAESVSLCNGGVHEEPVQLMNADFLWSGAAQGYAEEVAGPEGAETLFGAIAHGHRRPPTVFEEGGILHRACRRLWGDSAGGQLYRAYLSGGDGRHGPVSRVWWAVTRDVRRLKGDPVEHGWTWEDLDGRWTRRLAATEEALRHVRAANKAREDPDLRWLAHCLEVGRRFAEAVVAAIRYRLAGSADTRCRLTRILDELEAYVAAQKRQPVDLLGGDPGCWAETVALLRAAALSG